MYDQRVGPWALLLVVLHQAAASATGGDAAAAQVAATFERTLAAGEISRWLEVAGRRSSSDAPALRSLLERLDGIHVASLRATIAVERTDSLLVRLEVRGWGTTRAPAARVVPVPALWWVTVARPGTSSAEIVPLETEADRVARSLLAATEDQRAGLLAIAQVEEGAVAESLSTIRIDAHHRDAARLLALWVRERARARSDLAAELQAAVLLARLARIANDRDGAFAFVDDWLRRHGDAAPIELVARAKIAAADALWEDAERWQPYLDEIVAELDAIGDPPILIDALELQARLHIEHVQLTAARESVEHLAALAARFGWARGAADAEFHAAGIYRTLHDDATAAVRFARSAELAAAAGDQGRHARGLLWQVRSEMRTSLTPARRPQRLREVLATAPADEVDLRASILASLAEASAGQPSDADEAISALLPLIPLTEDPYVRQLSWKVVGQIHHARGRPAQAVDAYLESLRAGPHNMLWLAWATKTHLARALHELGRDDEAVVHLRDAVELIEARLVLVPNSVLGGVRYFRDKIGVYASLAKELVLLGRDEEGLQVAERVRARVLGEIVAGGLPAPQLSAEDRRRQRELVLRIVALNRSLLEERRDADETRQIVAPLREARLELESFATDLAIRRPEEALRFGRANPLSPGAGAFPPPGTAVVEYLLADDSVMVFVVRRREDGRILVRGRLLPLAPRAIWDAAADLTTRITTRDLGVTTSARHLHQALVAPIENLLAGSSALCIVPDGMLWSVPFQALQGGDGLPLVAKYTLSYSPSIGLADLGERRLANHPPSDPSLLAFGNPRAGARRSTTRSAALTADLGDLPDAEREVSDIGRLYERRGLYIRASAGESVAKALAGEYDILHFATHGMLDDENPMFSALLMADADGNEDGLLEAREVAEMRLHANVAILSACETAKGTVYPGEGVVGIAWAFLAAGCPTTVVSQWKVASQSTSVLMVEFHRRLLAGASAAEALRQAQLSLMRDERYAHPFYWAPFVVIGAPGS